MSGVPFEVRQARFLQFHAENPEVYRRLVALARKARAAGVRVGIRLCWERLRWDRALQVKRGPVPEADWKLSDHYPPFYARLIDEREPDLRGYFELRDRSNVPHHPSQDEVTT